MKTKKVLLLTIFCALALMLSVNLAKAADATVATLHTTDSSGNDKVQFAIGETIYIRWTADGTVNIEVKFQNGTTDGQWLNQSKTGTIAYTPTKGAGYYAIYCTGALPIPIAYGTLLVTVPETPLGTIMASAACFGALLVFGIKKLTLSHYF
ncbi:hypothetical protein DRO69_03670 [Candidatus Bathyarchaeota archaeon]|nr:MAG: hypothetical protein DRO69_03670 [Candidatus Bathyarchaeota archaeon]